MRKHLTCLVVLSGAMLMPAPADACKCLRTPVCQEFWEAELVFIGRAERVTTLQPGSERTEFIIKEQLRGQPPKGSLVVAADGLGASCDRSFGQGPEYLVFATRREDGSWRVANCGNTDAVARVPPADLAYVRRALTTPAEGSLSGVGMVYRKTRFDPLRRARVALRSNGREIVTQTDARGVYRFERVPPGDYMLEVSAPKQLAPIAPAGVLIGNGACASRSFTTQPR